MTYKTYQLLHFGRPTAVMRTLCTAVSLFLCLFFLTPHTYGKEPPRKKSPSTSKNIVKNKSRKPVTRKSSRTYPLGPQIATYRQLTSMSPKARVNYIRRLRAAMEEIEFWQAHISRVKFGASLLRDDSSSLVAHLKQLKTMVFPLAQASEAAAPSLCIYAGYIQNFHSNGIHCQRPATCDTDKKQTKCNPLLFGPNICVDGSTPEARINSTASCIKLSKKRNYDAAGVAKWIVEDASGNIRREWDAFAKKFNEDQSLTCDQGRQRSLCHRIRSRILEINNNLIEDEGGSPPGNAPQPSATPSPSPSSSGATPTTGGNNRCDSLKLVSTLRILTDDIDHTPGPLLPWEAQSLLCKKNSGYNIGQLIKLAKHRIEARRTLLRQSKDALRNEVKKTNQDLLEDLRIQENEKHPNLDSYYNEYENRFNQLESNLNPCTEVASNIESYGLKTSPRYQISIAGQNPNVWKLVPKAGAPPLQRHYFTGCPENCSPTRIKSDIESTQVYTGIESLALTMKTYNIEFCQIDFDPDLRSRFRPPSLWDIRGAAGGPPASGPPSTR